MATKFRFSTGVMTAEEAKEFGWETPIPINAFWDDIQYSVARSFIDAFTGPELDALPLDTSGSVSLPQKLELLLGILRARLEKEEAESQAAHTKSLYESDYDRWYDLQLAMYAYEDALNLYHEAEERVRMMVQTRPEGLSNAGPSHMLAGTLVRAKKYAEAEEVEKPVCAWMDQHPRLGKDSPQAINSRRFIIQAIWFQGAARRAEAERLIAELQEIVEGMGAGKFAIYQEEERKLNADLLVELV
ncbi:hypothetical protein MIND_01294400 [Mycena indigotica]|uniref:Uncharacterized protein n=1 Tax=Mycena indigotica TaxID=2126181 RepID=A0A8H6S1E5_9AGAR|nr:uncharacterized protein MIND_01294400 [Mycena indigotica]KAF7290543.1 hypothetical protein MIND_01294400 [Mycena indigotica]